MRKTIFVSLILLLVAGCAAEVDGWEIDKAIALCSEKGGYDKVITTFGARVVCRDGTLHEIAHNSN